MNRLSYLWLDLLEFLGKIEMKIKHFLNRKFYNSISENDIPKDTFYCYSGCRIMPIDICPYWDCSVIYHGHYCHYIEDFDCLLDDQCKMCGISEVDDE